MDLRAHGASAKGALIAALTGRPVLVTGGCGFVGRNLVDELLAQGATVTVFDRPGANWDDLPVLVSQVQGDIMDPEALAAPCAEAEIVYHLAARTDIDSEVVAEYAVNFTGTANVIAACAAGGRTRRFVFYSTQLVVGLFDQTRFIDESEPYRTRTAYGQSKIEGEQAVIRRCPEVGLAYTIIRPTSVYGPWGEEPYRAFFRTVKRRRYFHVGAADNLVSWLHVQNLVDLTVLASLNPAAANQIYFANDFHPYTMREIVDAVADYYAITVPTIPVWLITAVAYILALPKRWGLPVPIYPFRLRNIRAHYCYDIQRSIELGYSPRIGLREGIRSTLDWYEARGRL